MKRNPFFKLLRARTVQNKFTIIVGLIVIILIFSLADFWFGVKVMSGIRAYVGGEGLWSKAQKEAVSSLVQYAAAGDESNYDHYMVLLRVQAGDKQARLEMNKPNPNYATVRQGFIQGGNDAADVDDMVFLYRQFHQVSYMKAAIKTWADGDAGIVTLQTLGDKVRSTVLAAKTATSPKAIAAYRTEQRSLIRQTYIVDSHLTVLENNFSATLGQGSRGISNTLLRLTIFTTGLFGLLAVIIAVAVAKAIIRLDKSKTEFVSLASHQLRTPLTAINWYTEALLDGSRGQLNAAQRDYLTELAGGGHRMSNLINDILKVSSLDLGTYKSEQHVIRVGEVLKTVIKDQRAEITRKKITLTTNVQADLPSVKMDDQLLVAAFQNLLSNSVKYTPDGGSIIIDVTKHRGTLSIHVGDNGIGIPKAQQAHIFTKLFRADNAKQLDADGSGLGLYIVHALVERMNGAIWFKSSEHRGTDFYVTLPIYRGIHVRRSN